MSKKLILPLLVGFCLALALGSADEPSELTQEERNKDLVHRALDALSAQDVNQVNELFDPNYIHHLASKGLHLQDALKGRIVNAGGRFDPNDLPLTLDEMISWFSRDEKLIAPEYSIELYNFYDYDIIAEGEKVVIRFHRELVDWSADRDYPFFHGLLSSEVWILRIADGKIVEGWSVSEPGPAAISQEDMNKALVKEAILAYAEEPIGYNFPEQFDPNYVQWDPWHPFDYGDAPGPAGVLDSLRGPYWRFNFEHISAEGDIVTVLVSMWDGSDVGWTWSGYQLGMYRIADGKIVEGWVSASWSVWWY